VRPNHKSLAIESSKTGSQSMTAKARQIEGCTVILWIILTMAPLNAKSPESASMLSDSSPKLQLSGERMQKHYRSGIAMQGFDPVSYFAGSTPLAGKPNHESVVDGVTWRFASEANQQAFLADHKSFWPEFEGYEGLAVSRGQAVESNPVIFAVINGRIYFFRSTENRDIFMGEPSLAAKAEEKWPEVYRQLSR
jgi:YHS domain-containing protein